MRPQGAAKDIGRIYAAMHPSVCGIRRIHLPLQGRLCRRLPLKKAPLQGELSPQVTEGCIAAQDQMVSFCIGTDPSCGGRSPAFLIPRPQAAPQFLIFPCLVRCVPRRHSFLNRTGSTR